MKRLAVAAVSTCALLVFAAAPGRSADAPAEGKPAASADKPAEKPAPPPSATRHTITVGGRPIAYTATAATIDLENDDGEAIGRMFYVAYVRDATAGDGGARPVTFCFNGGPGSSSLWLEMGSFGPMRVEATDAAPTPPPPYRVVENPESLLDVTDLVFIDAMGTGYSRVLPKGKAKDFYGTDPDIAAFGQFIRRWVTQNQRWNAPKFLLGESYGTTRAAGLLAHLAGKGMAFNGSVMVSSYLNAWDDFNGPPFSNDRAYELYLPTMAATAWYHGRLEHFPKSGPAVLEPLLTEVRAFALGEYSQALAKGNRLADAERASVIAKLRRYTGMPEDLLRRANLRIDPSRFQKELLRDERRTVGRLDGRFQGIDHDAAGETPESDAASDAFSAAFVAAWNIYVAADLRYQANDLYKPSNYEEVGKDWDDHHRADGFGRAALPDTAEDLRRAMSINPRLKIFSANGYYDFATPFFETEYTMAHMGLEPELEKNITWAYYEAGHMMYINPEARKKMKADLATFYREALSR